MAAEVKEQRSKENNRSTEFDLTVSLSSFQVRIIWHNIVLITELTKAERWPPERHFLIVIYEPHASRIYVFPHVWIPQRPFLLGGSSEAPPQRIIPGSVSVPLFACWTCDRNHGYDLGDGKPLHSPGCEVLTGVWLSRSNKEAPICQDQ